MPSVRVRRKHAYSSLRDQALSESAAPSPRPRSASVLSASARRSRSITFPGSPDDPTDSPEFSSSPLSHVYRSVRRNSLSYRSGRPLSEQGAYPALHDVLFEGRQTDVVVPDQNPRSRVGNALIAPGTGLDEENQLAISESDSDYDSDDAENGHDNHDADVVEHLDVIDPQVATVSTLANAANAIVFPPVSVYSRKPVVVLPATPRHVGSPESSSDDLDRHVHHVLAKRDQFKRIMRGVWMFLKTPMGVLVGIYGFLVVIWGSAIVLFLAKWINLHNDDLQDQWIELSCQICNVLFCITGLGLAPWRILDTWRIYKIWWYKRRTEKLRHKHGLPELFDSDDLPDPVYDPNYVHVLTDEEQADLHHQQTMFRKSQTWYRPHGTETHRAFPIGTALLICLLNFGNSFFQAMLSGCMWSMDRFERPAWTTGCLIPASFLCGIFSGVFIWRGGQKTKRTERVEQYLRAALAKEHQLRHPDDAIPAEGKAKNLSLSLQRMHRLESSIPEDKEQEDIPMTIRMSFEDGNVHEMGGASAVGLLDGPELSVPDVTNPGTPAMTIDEEMFVPPRP